MQTATQLVWADTCSTVTIQQAWKSFNGAFSDGGFSFDEFAYSLQAAQCVRATQVEFDRLCVENTCVLDAPDEAEAKAILEVHVVDRATGGTECKVLEPIVLGRFGSRIVILAGTTRYRAAEMCKSDIGYVCADMDNTACMGCMPM